ncbi:MAG: glycosyltransferase family 2 protein, partial [Candidatus Binatia bacterium]
MSSGEDFPAMSVVLATPGDFRMLRATIGHLLAQTARARLEIVLVTPAADRLGLDAAELAPFAAVQVVATGSMRSKASANAAGVRRARAEVVALAEDHCFPEPEWAAALIRRHAEPWAAVGPVISNANPATLISWSDLVVNYGPWL